MSQFFQQFRGKYRDLVVHLRRTGVLPDEGHGEITEGTRPGFSIDQEQIRRIFKRDLRVKKLLIQNSTYGVGSPKAYIGGSTFKTDICIENHKSFTIEYPTDDVFAQAPDGRITLHLNIELDPCSPEALCASCECKLQDWLRGERGY